MLTQNTPLAIRPSVSTAFACRSKVRHQRQSTVVRARFDSNKGSDRSVLEAFFLGRAFAETVNDRLGAALGDLLSEIAKADAERRQAWKEFESAPTGPVATSRSQPQNSSASQLLLQETVDDVRAEVASARAVLQQYKASKNQGTA
ncbi:hypothetical protein WJX79_005092 [Trebouxia sp. C0005]